MVRYRIMEYRKAIVKRKTAQRTRASHQVLLMASRMRGDRCWAVECLCHEGALTVSQWKGPRPGPEPDKLGYSSSTLSNSVSPLVMVMVAASTVEKIYQ